MMNVKEAKERVERIKGIIAEQEERISEQVAEMQKRMKKGDLSGVKHCNHMIKKHFENIEEYKEWLETAKFDLVKAMLLGKLEGFEVVLEFLEDLLEDDIKWHENLVAQFKADRKSLDGATKIVKAFARMSAAEALSVFRQDLQTRFAKLIKQVNAKVGEIEKANLHRNENDGFDGYIIGSNGTVSLNTIIAGGYNIQRAHYRTLIKKAA